MLKKLSIISLNIYKSKIFKKTSNLIAFIFFTLLVITVSKMGVLATLAVFRPKLAEKIPPWVASAIAGADSAGAICAWIQIATGVTIPPWLAAMLATLATISA